MKAMRYIWFIGLMFIGLTSCKKEVEEPFQPLVFTNISASSTTFNAGSSVHLNANATGTGLSYHWSYNTGAISGGGSSVNYSNEEPGSHTVLCTVVDIEGNVEAREIILYVQ